MQRAILFKITLAVLCLSLGYNAGLAKCFDDPPPSTAKEDAKPAAQAPSPNADDKESQPDASAFKDEPAAHALYNQMIESLRKADSLSYVSEYSFQGKGDFKRTSKYWAWLKKPNYFRLETESPQLGKGGILIGDGDTLWIYWPQGRPMGLVDETSEDDKKTRFSSYMTEPAPLARHSIGHQTGLLGSGLGMPILDPSTFHGYTDSLQPYIDGVKSIPSEKIGDEECDGIEVSIMKHQRSWYLWLSPKDHLPRKLKEIVRVSYDLTMTEDWSSVTVNGDIPDEKFAWKPPEGWTEWKYPPIEAGLLKPGVVAPDFELDSTEDRKIKLSDYRGKIVWFYVWRAG